MKAPIKWLKDFVNIDISPEALAEKLLSAGFEVEEIYRKGDGIEKVVVGKILEIYKHPNADKLQICSIDAGGQPLQIVTGAHNISVGDYVPVALDGAKLPGGKEIFAGELRGEKSVGMLCSGSELGLTEDDYPGSEAHGILILKKGAYAPGKDVREALGLDEAVLDISVTANRPDCQSIYGMAREIAAILGKKLKPLDLTYPVVKKKTAEVLRVEVPGSDLCPKYTAHVAENVQIKASNAFISERLRLAGLRPINNIVDITNFVLLEIGQPMHAFDLSKIAGGTIIVRHTEDGEEITALDGKTYRMDSDMLAICDAEKPIAIAGIMGGENSKTQREACAVAFESAVFMRQSIRRNSRKLGLRSDSSSMYERGVSRWACETGAKRALCLLTKFGWGDVLSGQAAFESGKQKRVKIKAPVREIDTVLGISVPPRAMVKILNSLEIATTLEEDVLTCVIPPYREDIVGIPDLAEEIIRMYGYDNIKGTMLKNCAVTNGTYTTAQSNLIAIENALTRNGYHEAVTYSFTGRQAYDSVLMDTTDCIKLMNPLGEEVSLMRTQLISGMLSVVAGNLRKGNISGRLFENASIYLAKQLPLTELPIEERVLSLAAFGDGEDFYTMKGSVARALAGFGTVEYVSAQLKHMHPKRCAQVILNGKNIGYMGEVHPSVLKNYDVSKRVYYAEINLESFIANEKKHMKYRDISKFAGTYRDLAIIVDEQVCHGDLQRTIEAFAGEFLESVELFDIYRDDKIGAKKKSMAYNIRFRSKQRTLQDADIDPIMDRILSALQDEYGAQLRA